MPKTDLKIYSTDSSTATKITTTVSYMNPNATNSTMKEFAQKLNSLTTNVYSETDKVVTTNLEDAGDEEQSRNIQISGATKGGTAVLTFNWDSELDTSTKPAVWSWSSGTSFTFIEPSAPTADGALAKCTFSVPSNSNALYAGIVRKNGFYSEFVMVTVS